jgi:tetratricopeptide (TPR) repeat protein
LLQASDCRYETARSTIIPEAFMTTPATEPNRQVWIGRAFDDARTLQSQGKLHEAEELYGRVLEVEPQHVAALFRLGVLRAQLGRRKEAVGAFRCVADVAANSADIQFYLGMTFGSLNCPREAIACYQRALAVAPNHADAHNNLGNVLHALGRTDEAIAHYTHALAIQDDHADAHSNLGHALHALGRYEDAIAHYQRALTINKDHAGAHNNFGSSLHALGRAEEALWHFRRAVAINPSFAQAHCNVGGLLAALDRRDEAVAHFRQALAIRPDDPDAHRHLADQLAAHDRIAEAIGHYEIARAIRPDSAEICCGLANALQKQRRFAESIAHYARAIAIRPDSAEIRNNLGNSLLALDRNDEAIAQFEASLAINPATVEAQNNIGVALQALGRFEDAAQAYEAAVKLAPGRAVIHLNLARLKPTDASRLATLEALALDPSARNPEESIALQFALAKAYADRNDPERSFRHLIAGNALKRRHVRYDEAESLALFERIRTVFTADLFERKAGSGDPCPVPVFVVGMPRSGTTLVEQILASHSKVFGAGEREDLGATIAGFEANGEAFPERVRRLSSQELRQFGSNYIGAIRASFPTAERIVDKMPINFLYVGLIHLALANARIIHVRRDPIDTCFSCFSMLFVGDQPYTYDLGELGRYYRAYEALMAHWRQVLPPGVMIEVRYEDIVDDLQGQAAAMVGHCGLAFEESCIAFHETRRPVRTASSTQVRQPIYRSSVGRWRAYEHLLQPLRQVLEASDTVPVYPDPFGPPVSCGRAKGPDADGLAAQNLNDQCGANLPKVA